jgi:hypothetical protein
MLKTILIIWSLLFSSGVFATPTRSIDADTITSSDHTKTYTLPATTATIARTDAAQTFTGVQTFTAPVLVTPTTLVGTNITGTAASLTSGLVTSIGNLTGDVTSVNRATTLAAATVTGKALTGFTGVQGVVLATDTILAGINKISGTTVYGVCGLITNCGMEGGNAAGVATGWASVAGTTTISVLASEVYEGLQAQKIVLAAQTLAYTSTVVTTNAALAGTPGSVSIAVNFASAILTGSVCAVVDTVEQTCIPSSAITNNGIYKEYVIPIVFGSTSVQIKVKTTGAETGTVLIDKGAIKLGTPTRFTSVDSDWLSYTPTLAGLGTTTPSTNQCKWKRQGGDLLGQCFFTAGTVSGQTSLALPTGLILDTTSLLSSAVLAGPNQIVGEWSNNASNLSGRLVVATGTANNLIYFGAGTTSTGILAAQSGTPYPSSSVAVAMTFRVPISGWSSNTTTYSAASSDFSPVNAGVMTLGATTTAPIKGTVVTDRIIYSKKGSRIISDYQYEQSAGGTNSTGNVLFTLPAGLSFDSNYVNFVTGVDAALVTANPKAIVGYGAQSNNGSNFAPSVALAYDATHFRMLLYVGGQQFLGGGTGIVFSGALGMSAHIDAPIAGWIDTGVIYGTFNNVAVIPGISKAGNVGAEVTSAGVITRQLGTGFSSCTNASPSVCSFTTAFATIPLCIVSSGGSGGITATVIDSYVSAITTSAVSVITATAAGVATQGNFTVNCTGSN